MKLKPRDRKLLARHKATFSVWQIILERIIYFGLLLFFFYREFGWGGLNFLLLLFVAALGVYGVIWRLDLSRVLIPVIDEALKDGE